MHTQVTESTFRDAFERCGRHTAWTYEGLGLLFDYLTKIEDATEQMKLDVVELDGTYAQYTHEELESDSDLWDCVVAEDAKNDIYIVEG